MHIKHAHIFLASKGRAGQQNAVAGWDEGQGEVSEWGFLFALSLGYLTSRSIATFWWGNQEANKACECSRLGLSTP